MVDQLCDSITKKIRKENPSIDDERAEVINYGIHLIVGEFPKFFIIMGLAFLLGVGDLALWAFILMLPYRTFSGGFHLKTHLGCIVASTLFYSGPGLLAKYLILSPDVKYIVTIAVWIFGMIMVKLYAPADTEDIPILTHRARRTKRILSYITLTLSLVASILIKDVTISNILLYGIFIQTLTITKIAYKLTNNKYGYEVYNTSKQSV